MRRSIIWFLAWVVFASSSISAQIAGKDGVEGNFPPGPTNIPSAAEQAKIARSLRQKFQAELASRDPVVCEALARTLRASAVNNSNDGEKFVYLREARESAIRAGDMPLTMEIIDDIVASFGPNTSETKEIVLNTAVGKALIPPDELGTSYLKVADAALLVWDLDLAQRAAWLAERVSTANSALLKAARKREALCRDRKNLALEVTKAEYRLAKNQNDPQLNQIVGAYYCFDLNNWRLGLPYLSQSGSSRLKAMAEKDQAAGTDPSALVALADAWWEFADPMSGLAIGCGHRRAVYWYECALPKIDGESKTRSEKRIAEAKAEKPVEP